MVDRSPRDSIAPRQEVAAGGRKNPIPAESMRRACMRLAAGLLQSHGLESVEAIESAIGRALEELGPAAEGSPVFERRLLEGARAQLSGDSLPQAMALPLDQTQAMRNLLHVCVHPGLQLDCQRAMLLRFAFWLPNDVAAQALETGPATVGIHLRKSYRRLRALARRGDGSGIFRRFSRGGTVLEHFAGLRLRAAAMRRASPTVAAVLEADVEAFASVLAGTEGGPSRGESHAFLAELLLAEERSARKAAAQNPRLTGAVSERISRGLRHLRSAEEMGVDTRFMWLARIHATYLQESDPARTDWRQLVHLYERLLGVSERDRPPRNEFDFPAA